MKRKVGENPILVLPDFNKPFQVRCDSSGRAIGVVLSLEDRLIAYFSEKLNGAKHKSSSYDQNIYAIFQVLKKWRHYLMSGELFYTLTIILFNALCSILS